MTLKEIVSFLDETSCFSPYENKSGQVTLVHDWEDESGYLNTFECRIEVRDASAFGKLPDAGRHIKTSDLKQIRSILEDMSFDGESSIFIYV